MCDIKARVRFEEVGGSTLRPPGFLETDNTFPGTAKNGLRFKGYREIERYRDREIER